MDKLKNLIKSDTPTSENVASGATGKITGQGSHFPSKEETSVTGTGATAPGDTLQTKGPEDVSAVPASSTAAATTAGPEQSGSSHVNTVSAASDPPSSAYTTGTARDAANPTEYTVASADFPQTQTSSDGSGTAAVGQTSTYSSSYVGKGDPTSSVVDPQSSDPLTYKKPESGTHLSETGVGAGAAAAAASVAFDKGEERKKEDMSGYENPYRAVTLDPRVDGLPKSSTDAPATGVGAGAAGLGASQAFNSSQGQAPAPSTLTTSVDPAERSAEYGQTTTEKGLPESTTATSAAPAEKAADTDSGMVGKVLGAVGLGSIAGLAGYKAGSEKDTAAVAETPEQPTTTTGIESYTAPTEQGPPTAHHRKESIPTTAYPSASFDSPRAINQPVGGAGSPVVHGDRDTHTARDVGVGAATGGAAIGAAAVGAHEYEQSKTVREGISGEPQASAPVLKEPADTTATTGVNPSQYTESQQLRQNIVSDTPTATGASSAEAAPKQEEDHTARNAAIGAGAGAAVVGAGAAGAHEYSKKEAEKAEKEAAMEQAAHEKEIAKQKAAEQKELEKEHKAAEKAAAKEEKHHQKELEKEEKKHQKEVEKAEKQHQKEVEKAEKEEQHRREAAEAEALKEQRAREKEAARLEKQRAEEEEERKIREEKERLAGAVGIGGATAATADETEKEKELEKEKKPSLFKRIFKRRKNKDTGEDEDYESEEEDKSHHGTAAAAGGAAVVGGGAAAYAAEHEKSAHPGAESTTVTAPSTTEATGTSTQQPVGAVTGVPYDATKEPQTARSADVTQSKEIAPATIESTGTTTQQPTEAITGLPYDASKDPQAAARLGEHQHGEGAGYTEPVAQEKAAGTAAETTGEYPVKTDFTLGEVQDKEGNPVQPEEPHDMGLGEKLKATFHMGGLDS